MKSDTTIPDEQDLAWFCDYGVFGSCDTDHSKALEFPKATWSLIAAKPAKYLDAQWKFGCSFARYIQPWLHCAFIEE